MARKEPRKLSVESGSAHNGDGAVQGWKIKITHEPVRGGKAALKAAELAEEAQAAGFDALRGMESTLFDTATSVRLSPLTNIIKGRLRITPVDSLDAVIPHIEELLTQRGVAETDKRLLLSYAEQFAETVHSKLKQGGGTRNRHR